MSIVCGTIDQISEVVNNYIYGQDYHVEIMNDGQWFDDKIGNANESSLEHFFVKVFVEEKIMGIFFSIEKKGTLQVNLDIKGLSKIDSLMYNVSDFVDELKSTMCEHNIHEGYLNIFEDEDFEEFQREKGLILTLNGKEGTLKLDSMVTIKYTVVDIPNRHDEDCSDETIYKFKIEG